MVKEDQQARKNGEKTTELINLYLLGKFNTQVRELSTCIGNVLIFYVVEKLGIRLTSSSMLF